MAIGCIVKRIKGALGAQYCCSGLAYIISLISSCFLAFKASTFFLLFSLGCDVEQMSVTVGEIVRSAPDLRGYYNSGKNDNVDKVRAVGKCETSETCS